MSSQPVLLERAESISARTEAVLRDMLLRGEFKPGQRVNEVKTANALGISRGPLREALQRLASEGLVRLVSHRGAFVPDFSVEQVHELWELREALETMGGRLAAQRRSDDDVQELHSMLHQTEATLTANSTEPYPRELDFHQRVLILSGNQMLIDRAREVFSLLHLARARSASSPARARAAFREHLAVTRAIEDRNVDAAGNEMRAHLLASLAHVQALVEAGANPSTTKLDDREEGGS